MPNSTQSIRRCRSATAVMVALSFIGLSACKNGEFELSPLSDVATVITGFGEDEKTPATEDLASIGPPLYVGYNAIRVALPNTRTSGDTRTFSGPDGVKITMNQGHATQVIGLGIDLKGMFFPSESPYVNDFVQAARDGAVAERVADYYIKRKIVHDTFRCSLNYIPGSGNKGIVTEQCRRFFGGPGFRNTYWTEGNRIVCSLQWFHPDADYLQFFETPQQAQTLDLNKQGC